MMCSCAPGSGCKTSNADNTDIADPGKAERSREHNAESHGLSKSSDSKNGASKYSKWGIQLRDAALDSLTLHTVTVEHDPTYRRRKTYRGYRLRDVLRRIPRWKSHARNLQRQNLSRGDTLDRYALIFRCRDGYAPTMHLASALRAEGLVAVSDLDAPANKKWVPFHHGKQEVTPAPFYLVWEHVEPDDHNYRWPYQLEAVEIVHLRKEYDLATPIDETREGDFRVFRTHCMQCHSVNLVGGRVGPELNTPKNVLEYWSEPNFRAFVRDPRSFRARSSMPAQASLSEADLDAIVRYLRAMRSQKSAAR